MICVAYKHQFDLINESTGDAYRLHHVEANRVNFVAAIDVYEDGEAGLLLCYNYICYYKKVCPFNGSTPMIHSNTSDFHFSWNQMPNAIVCAFPYILAFTTDSIEIRLVVNGNLVYTAVVPGLELAASRSDIYFVSSAPVSSTSNNSSKDTSSQSSPQTPTGYEMPAFPSPLGDDSIRIPYGTKLSLYMSKDPEGESACKHIFKIPLSNLPSFGHLQPTHLSLTFMSMSRMEIKEIASRTRKELLGLTEEPSGKSDSKHRKMSKKNTEDEAKAKALTSTNSERTLSESGELEVDLQRQLSSSSEAEAERAVLQEDSPSLASAFGLTASFEEDVLDLK
ncbi:hypothetical protein WMY93_021765 [Mugilogobius chulae]|uniref:CNH domain-containing protein n=1 Tax=Mugilogobius chulae TaxID=88201 RepID=A0AAW0NET0_9GOBI